MEAPTLNGATAHLQPLPTSLSGVPSGRWSVHSLVPTTFYPSINSVKALRGLGTCPRCQETFQVWLLRFQLQLGFHLSPVFLSLSEACL